MIVMRPIQEPLVLEEINQGRFSGEVEGYVVMDGPDYKGSFLYKVENGVTWVLDEQLTDPSLIDGAVRAAVAAGADGLIIEVHTDPEHAWSDGAQCLTPDAFAQAMAKCRQVAWAIGRDM